MDNTTEISQFEDLADAIASPPNNEAYQKANQMLTQFTSDYNNFDKIHIILDKTK